MKRYALVVGLLIASIGLVHGQEKDPEFVQAVEWMYENGLTRYDTPQAYRPDARLTREQAAKFYVEFTKLYRGVEDPVPFEESWSSCDFNDTSNADPTLKDYMRESCLFELFKGSQGSFWPRGTLTKAEAITVLIRSIDGLKVENVTPWWKNYHLRARGLGITRENDVRGLDRPVTRYEIALLLYRASNGGVESDDDETDMLDIYQILSELGL